MFSLIPRLPVGHIRSRSLAKAKTTPGAGGYALLFPSNVSGSSTSSAYGVIQFANPQSDGFPPNGPSNAGWTVIRRIKTVQQTGYYAQWWYVQNNGSIDLNGPPFKFYAGFHPYPGQGGQDKTTHKWEIAANGDDYADYDDDNSAGVDVVKDVWFTQALKWEYNGGSPRATMYIDLPTVTTASQVRVTLPSGYGDIGNIQSSPAIVIGNSPWMALYQEERASCHHGQIKIITKALSEADIVSEAGNMNTLVTSDAQSNIWWGKTGFDSVDDLTCDYATARSFTRVDSSNILTLGDAL